MSQDAVLYRANPSMVRSAPLRFAIVIALCFVGVGIPILIVWWLRCKCTTLTVTESRVILRKGILSKSLNEVRHSHIRNVQLRQDFLQRILGVGWIGIASAGHAGVEIEVSGIPSPGKVKAIIDARV
jgi:uncharacterized membrane protein YdbT with pleckstrin-like domain